MMKIPSLLSICMRLSAWLLILGILLGAMRFYQFSDFPLYIARNHESRSNTSPIPSKDMIRVTSLWHERAVADLMWISLIQYIGANVGNASNSYVPHSLTLLDRITEVSPEFASAYEWALWLMPIPQNANLTYSEQQKSELAYPLSIAHRGIGILCDAERLQAIISAPLSADLWKASSLKNPCKSGMLPYLIAFYGGQLMGDARIAQEFYTIAGMQDDTPSVSQILAVIATAPKDTPKPIALNFAIMAAGAHDSEPFACSELTEKLFRILQQPHITRENILMIRDAQMGLDAPNYANSLGSQTCYDMLDRALKYTFLAFMNEQSERHPDATDINALLSKIPLDTVPTTATQSGMSMRHTEHGWEYYSIP